MITNRTVNRSLKSSADAGSGSAWWGGTVTSLALTVAVFTLALTATPAFADRYVRQGATGNGSGTDWTNACPSFSGNCAVSAWVRGETIWVADGTYTTSLSFNKTASGSLLTMKKATAALHGTDVGWQAAFGDGQAVFTGQMQFSTADWVIDGATRDESNWQNVVSYGFRFNNNSSGGSFRPNSSSATNVTIQYADIGGNVNEVCGQASVPPGSTTFYAPGGPNNWTIRRSHIHNTEIPFLVTGADNWVIEHNHIGPSWQKETISGQDTAGWIVRHNKFVDNLIYPPPACQHGGDGATADIGIRVSSTTNNNWQIYGNVFADSGRYANINRTGAIIQGNCWNDNSSSPTVTGWRVYNNTFYNIHGDWGRILICGSNNVAVNNLWHRAGEPSTRFGIDGAGLSGQTSWCYDDVANACSQIPGSKVSGIENPFVSAEALDFRLKTSFAGPSPVNTGTALGTGFDRVDAFGSTRGADGAWDIGAYERVAGGGSTSPPAPPTALNLQ